MTRIYPVKCIATEKRQTRKALTAEINLLRKFEGGSMIEERIDSNISKLHSLWFPKGKAI